MYCGRFKYCIDKYTYNNIHIYVYIYIIPSLGMSIHLPTIFMFCMVYICQANMGKSEVRAKSRLGHH